jgi:hypothetical protein
MSDWLLLFLSYCNSYVDIGSVSSASYRQENGVLQRSVLNVSLSAVIISGMVSVVVHVCQHLCMFMASQSTTVPGALVLSNARFRSLLCSTLGSVD